MDLAHFANYLEEPAAQCLTLTGIKVVLTGSPAKTIKKWY